MMTKEEEMRRGAPPQAVKGPVIDEKHCLCEGQEALERP